MELQLYSPESDWYPVAQKEKKLNELNYENVQFVQHVNNIKYNVNNVGLITLTTCQQNKPSLKHSLCLTRIYSDCPIIVSEEVLVGRNRKPKNEQKAQLTQRETSRLFISYWLSLYWHP